MTLSLLAQESAISRSEYGFLIDYLEITRDQITGVLDTIGEEAWTYKPEDGGWSIRECMEHIMLAEAGIFSEFQQVLKKAPQELDTKHLDAWLVSKVSDRGRKVITPLPMVDSGRSKAEFISDINTSRENIFHFISDFSQIPFRNHFGTSPYGPADAYQLLLVLGAHAMRHHAQMVEVLEEYQRSVE